MHTSNGISDETMRLIETTVKRALEQATKKETGASAEKVEDTYKETEKRLYRFSDLVDRAQDNRERLQDMIDNGLPMRSASLVMYRKTGTRIKPEDAFDALKENLEARIAADEYEITAIKKALRRIERDPYYMAVYGRFIENRTDEDIAEALFCEQRTIRRNRVRLVRKLTTWLYGV